MRTRRQLATCSADTTIKIWTPILPSPSSSPVPSPSPAADPGGGTTTYPRGGGGGGGGIADGTGYQLDKVLQGHQRWVWDMAYSADSAYLVSGASLSLSLSLSGGFIFPPSRMCERQD